MRNDELELFYCIASPQIILFCGLIVMTTRLESTGHESSGCIMSVKNTKWVMKACMSYGFTQPSKSHSDSTEDLEI